MQLFTLHLSGCAQEHQEEPASFGRGRRPRDCHTSPRQCTTPQSCINRTGARIAWFQTVCTFALFPGSYAARFRIFLRTAEIFTGEKKFAHVGKLKQTVLSLSKPCHHTFLHWPNRQRKYIQHQGQYFKKL